jgi:hypothetical protein
VPYLLEKYHIKNVRSLLIDVEGFDHHVVKQIPFQSIRPQLIMYEYRHIAVEDRLNSIHLLHKHCYHTWDVHDNTVAIAFEYLDSLM